MKGVLFTDMKKFFIIFMLVALSIFILSACSGEPDVQADPDPPHEADNTPPAGNDNTGQDPPVSNTNDPTGDNGGEDGIPPPPDVFFFAIRDVVIDMNENISYVIEKLGDPMGIMVMESCAFDGDDRIYRYPGADLYTYPLGDNDFIHTVAFFDDTIRTAEGGIRLDSALQAVINAYGEDYELESDMYTYTRGKTTLEFLVSEDVVIGITYRYNLDDIAW